MTIVGWDDNFSAGKFSKHAPKANGAWIVRNSWGNQAPGEPANDNDEPLALAAGGEV